jgi:hypothetical protein
MADLSTQVNPTIRPAITKFALPKELYLKLEWIGSLRREKIISNGLNSGIRTDGDALAKHSALDLTIQRPPFRNSDGALHGGEVGTVPPVPLGGVLFLNNFRAGYHSRPRDVVAD